MGSLAQPPKSAQEASTAWFDEATLSPLGAGHIHDTFKVESAGATFVLQRVNEYVFRDGDLVMDQTERLLACWSKQNTYLTPELVATKRDERSFRNEAGLWRVWRFIEGSRTIDPVENPAQAEAVGQAFGALQASLAGLDGPHFHDTIEGFLDLKYYLDAFSPFASQAPSDLREKVTANRSLAHALAERQTHIHGDCKVNNVLFGDASDDVLAVIDFDTAMYGHWAWDFGDLIRSICFSAGGYRPDLFEACLKGFASKQTLTTSEDAVIAPQYVALMLGVRFLTDHLAGDVYFKTSHPGQNLERAKEQFEIFDAFVSHAAEMREIATRVLAR